ncbi:MAG: permease [Pseudomonadota bacterium]
MTQVHTIDQNNVRTGWYTLLIAFGSYAVIAVTLSATGVFSAIDTNIFPAVVAIATIGLTLSYFYVPSIRSLAENLGPYGLASFHVWRIPAALTFLYYGYQGWLPMTFVNLAGWGDMLAGVLAATLFLLPRAARTVAGFHIIGFTDFVIAVGTGIVLNFLEPSSMANILLLPVAIIPLVGVPLSGATHIAALHQLWVKRA